MKIKCLEKASEIINKNTEFSLYKKSSAFNENNKENLIPPNHYRSLSKNIGNTNSNCHSAFKFKDPMLLKKSSRISNRVKIFLPKKNILKNSTVFSIKTIKKPRSHSSNQNKKILLNKKLGRQSNSTKEEKIKAKHSSKTSDNIISKINKHFLNFLVIFINIILEVLYIGDKTKHFRQISPLFKGISSKVNNLNILLKMKICDIISENLTAFGLNRNNESKISKYNCELIKKLYNNEYLKNILNLNYIDIFINYYYKKEKLLKLSINKRNFQIGKKLKFFCDLLKKYENDSDELKRNSRIYFVNPNYLSHQDFLFPNIPSFFSIIY